MQCQTTDKGIECFNTAKYIIQCAIVKTHLTCEECAKKWQKQYKEICAITLTEFEI